MQDKIDSYYKFSQRQIKDIQAKKTVLIVIDMQKYQVQKDFTAYKAFNKITPGLLDYFISEVENKVIPNLQKLINFCHEVGTLVIYTKYSSYMPNGSDLPTTTKK
ncbi:MAG: hypothetical protein ACFE96_07220 [Candidatus Hermodarchaeota archaeon]